MSEDHRSSIVPGRRFLPGGADGHWSTGAASAVLSAFPDRDTYTCAAGISPSGVVHFGNFRDVITSLMVVAALREQGKSTRFIFSWDDFDRFRKVPQGVDPSFSRYIGMPLTSVPDPLGELASYACRFELEFEDAMEQLGIQPEYRYQTQQYRSGVYDSLIVRCLERRREIADTLLSFMSDKARSEKGIVADRYRDSFWPVSVYSRFTRKDSTRVLSFNEESGQLTYLCSESGKTDVVDLTKERIAKLSWKVDWPMRWSVEDVVFEPGGKDHAAPGGSYDVASTLARQLFDREAPVFIGYEFIRLQGMDAKMSGSSGLAVSPAKLLEIYEPALLKWLYARKSPSQGFALAFDSEVFRQYDEFDREAAARARDELDPMRRMAFDLSLSGTRPTSRPISFRQAVAFGQILQWSAEKVFQVSSDLALDYELRSIASRLPKARSWLETYNPGDMVKLNDSVNSTYAATMSQQAVSYVRQLQAALSSGAALAIAELESLVYAIPKDPALEQKENASRQRAFFKDVYNLLIGSSTGPRLSTFLWAADREIVLRLLAI